MSKDILLIGGAAAVVVLMLNKAKAQVAPAGSASAPILSNNVQNQMWGSLLGQGWKALTSAQNADGSPAFLSKNWLGQITTSDGVVVSDEVTELFPATYGGFMPVDLSAPGGGADDYLSIMGW